jgi:hypothetical protein
VPSERVFGAESVDPGGFAEDLGRGQRPASDDGKQGRRQGSDLRGDLLVELVDLGGEPPDVLDQAAGELGDESVEGDQVRVNPGEGAGPVEFGGGFRPGSSSCRCQRSRAIPGSSPGAAVERSNPSSAPASPVDATTAASNGQLSEGTAITGSDGCQIPAQGRLLAGVRQC